MTLGGLDRSLRNILSVIICWDQLVHHLVNYDGILELFRALIVEHMMFGVDPTSFQPIYHNLVSHDDLRRVADLHGLHTYVGTIHVNTHHDLVEVTSTSWCLLTWIVPT